MAWWGNRSWPARPAGQRELPVSGRWVSFALLAGLLAVVGGVAHLVGGQIEQVRALGELIDLVARQRLLSQRLSVPMDPAQAEEDSRRLLANQERIATCLGQMGFGPEANQVFVPQVASLDADVRALLAERRASRAPVDPRRTEGLVGRFSALVADIASRSAASAARLSRVVNASAVVVALALLLLWSQGAEPLRKKLERQARDRERNAVSDFMEEASSGDLTAGVQRLTDMFAQMLGCARVGLWVARGEDGPLECLDLFERESTRHGPGPAWERALVPRFTARVKREPLVLSSDVGGDPLLERFRHSALGEGWARCSRCPCGARSVFRGWWCAPTSGADAPGRPASRTARRPCPPWPGWPSRPRAGTPPRPSCRVECCSWKRRATGRRAPTAPRVSSSPP